MVAFPTVALYARVAGDEQRGVRTLAGQHAALQAYCTLYGLSPVQTYADEGVAGVTKLDERPGGAALLQDAMAGKFSVVLVERMDRLADALQPLVDALTTLHTYGVAVRSITEVWDTSTPAGVQALREVAPYAATARRELQERQSSGKVRQAQQGAYGGGYVPMGYVVDADGQYQVSRERYPGATVSEAEMVREIFANVAKGKTLAEEVARLTEAGIDPMVRYRGELRPSDSQRWTTARLEQMLHNRAYLGEKQFRAASGTVVIPIPALVSRAVWERTQRQLTKNRHAPHGNQTYDYLLRGLIVCGQCGKPCAGELVRSSGGTPRHYYRCTGARKRGEQRCPRLRVLADPLERQIWHTCTELILKPHALLDQLRQARQRESPPLPTVDVAALQQKLATAQAQRERLLDLVMQATVTTDTVKTRLARAEEDCYVTQRLLEAIGADRQKHAAMAEHYASTEAMLRGLQQGLRAISQAQDHGAMRAVIEQIVVTVVLVPLPGTRERYRVEVQYAF